MIVLVKWQEHDRNYTIGLTRFLKELNLNVDNAKIEQTIKRLLEQEEMSVGESEHE